MDFDEEAEHYPYKPTIESEESKISCSEPLYIAVTKINDKLT